MVDCLGKCILVCESAITTREASAADQMIPSVRPAIILAPREMRRQAGHVSSLARCLAWEEGSTSRKRQPEGKKGPRHQLVRRKRTKIRPSGHVEMPCSPRHHRHRLLLSHFSAGRCLLLAKQLRRCLCCPSQFVQFLFVKNRESRWIAFFPRRLTPRSMPPSTLSTRTVPPPRRLSSLVRVFACRWE